MGQLIAAAAVVGILGAASFVLGMVAQYHRVTWEDVRISVVDGSCGYSAAPACGLGITAALLILAAQIVANAFGGCVCCCRRTERLSSAAKTGAILCLVFSWMATMVALALLLSAGVLNASLTYHTPGDCKIPARWPLPVGAVLALASTLLLLLFLLLALHRQRQRHAPAPLVEMPMRSQQQPQMGVPYAYAPPTYPKNVV